MCKQFNYNCVLVYSSASPQKNEIDWCLPCSPTRSDSALALFNATVTVIRQLETVNVHQLGSVGRGR